MSGRHRAESEPEAGQHERGGKQGGHLREVAKSGAFNIVGSVVGSLATFALVAIITRGAGVTVAGLYFQAVGIISAASAVAVWGAPLGVMRAVSARLAIGDRDLRPALAVTFIPIVTTTVIMAVAVVVFAPDIATVVTAAANESTMTTILRTLAPALPFMAITRMAVAASRGAGATWPAVVYDVAGQPLVRTAICVVIAARHLDSSLYGVAWSVASGVSALFATVTLVGTTRGLSRRVADGKIWDKEIAKRFWAFTAPRGLEEFFQVSNAWLLIVLVGALASARDAAVYAAVSRTAAATATVLQGVIFALAPRLSAAFATKDYSAASHLYRSVTTWLIAITVPFVALLTIFPGGYLSIISPSVRSGAAALVILAVPMLANVVAGPSNVVLLMAGKSSWTMTNASISIAVTLVVAVLLIPHGGANAASISWGAAILVQNGLALYQIWRGFRMQPISRAGLAVGAVAVLLPALPSVVLRVFVGDRPVALVASALIVVLLAGGFALRLGRTRVLALLGQRQGTGAAADAKVA